MFYVHVTRIVILMSCKSGVQYVYHVCQDCHVGHSVMYVVRNYVCNKNIQAHLNLTFGSDFSVLPRGE